MEVTDPRRSIPESDREIIMPLIPWRSLTEIKASEALASELNERHPSAIDWQISAAGTVYTGVMTPELDRRRYGATVIALALDQLYLEVWTPWDERNQPNRPYITDLVPVDSPAEAERLWIKIVVGYIAQGWRPQT